MIKRWEVVYHGSRHSSVVRRCYTRIGAWWWHQGMSDRFAHRRAS